MDDRIDIPCLKKLKANLSVLFNCTSMKACNIVTKWYKWYRIAQSITYEHVTSYISLSVSIVFTLDMLPLLLNITKSCVSAGTFIAMRNLWVFFQCLQHKYTHYLPCTPISVQIQHGARSLPLLTLNTYLHLGYAYHHKRKHV